MVDLGHQGETLLFLELPGGDVLDDADDPLDLPLGVTDPLTHHAQPDHRPISLRRRPALHLVAVIALEAGEHQIPGHTKIVGMNQREEGAPPVGRQIAGDAPGDGRHALADNAEIARHVILKLPQAGGLKRQLQMLHFKARASGVIDHDQSLTPGDERCDKNRAKPAKI